VCGCKLSRRHIPACRRGLLSDGLGLVRAPSGSKITLSALEPGSGTLSLQVGKSVCKLDAPIAGRAGYGFVLRENIPWQFVVSLGHAPSRQSGALRVIPDHKPSVRITSPARDLTLAAFTPFKLAATASDDYGLTQMALEYLVSGQKLWQTVELGASGLVQKVEYEWDLSPLNLKPDRASATTSGPVTMTLSGRKLATAKPTVSWPTSVPPSRRSAWSKPGSSRMRRCRSFAGRPGKSSRNWRPSSSKRSRARRAG